MIRLTVATLAALYAVLFYLGDDTRRAADVSRTVNDGLTLAVFVPDVSTAEAATAVNPRMTDAEAIRAALAAGAELRSERKRVPLAGEIRIASTATALPQETRTDPLWTVTGDRVNLRGGPGTSNAVVGQVGQGDQAEVLEDRDGWYRIELANGSASGWIYGRFLSENS